MPGCGRGDRLRDQTSVQRPDRAWYFQFDILSQRHERARQAPLLRIRQNLRGSGAGVPRSPRLSHLIGIAFPCSRNAGSRRAGHAMDASIVCASSPLRAVPQWRQFCRRDAGQVGSRLRPVRRGPATKAGLIRGWAQRRADVSPSHHRRWRWCPPRIVGNARSDTRQAKWGTSRLHGTLSEHRKANTEDQWAVF